MAKALRFAVAAALACSPLGCGDAQATDGETHDELAQASSALDWPYWTYPAQAAAPSGAQKALDQLTRQGYRSFTDVPSGDAARKVGGALRVVVPTDAATAATDDETRRLARRGVMREVAAAGLLNDGDIVGLVQPRFGRAKLWHHVLSNLSHTSYVTVDRTGAATRVQSHDLPFTGAFAGGTSELDSPAHADPNVEAFHIFRPRAMTAEHRANAKAWTTLLRERITAVRGWVLLANPFSGDGTINFTLYPNDAAIGEDPARYATLVGRILLGLEQGARVEGLCAEMSWILSTLARCSLDEVRAAPPGAAAPCARPPFRPMPLAAAGRVGHVEAAMRRLQSARDLDERDRETLLNEFLTDGSGSVTWVQAYANALLDLQGFAPLLRGYYGATFRGGDADGARDALRRFWTTDHVWPHSFLLSASLPEGHADRGVDYVATVVFNQADARDRGVPNR